jgi:hypothetical protein
MMMQPWLRSLLKQVHGLMPIVRLELPLPKDLLLNKTELLVDGVKKGGRR